ncbi:hypothetical protein ACKI1I_02040 [Streptomyces turgidiscabies]|uniref:Uncharacterized protein n=1 Tax=Streptomyces turgidiscabies (strain Car8) TaxID=698760 RepID=L7EV72_STRT8|nr:hypothetical protein [Streptomyces turgidiscabies]ELP62942.1 hypothetical protein STRTUCAR8_05360 [Streptomyces turgidiscabies Car8]MDX3492322.1 hypothetical protein [Streptomyces turgidiscabies]GAQ69386.1 hypothetical protein T45_01110 [Streptomyces turgidiscabies]
MSDDQQSDDAPETPDQHRPEGRTDDREGAEETDRKQDGERDDKEDERALAAEQFKAYTRAPFAEEQGEDGPTDLASASRTRRATRTLFESGRDLTSVDRSFFNSAHFGDIVLGTDARLHGPALRSGPVPADELRTLRRAHVVPEGYVGLRNALRARRLLVLGAAPGTGRTSTALSLLAEVTADAPEATGSEAAAGSPVRRVDPDGVRQLAGKLGDDDFPGRTGYLLELLLTRPGALPPDELDLDELATALARFEAFAVLVVTVGSAAGPLLAGRYGMLCPPAPTQELLTTRLRERLESHVTDAPEDTVGLEELLARAEELARSEEVVDAVGLKDLRPAEAELLASLLAGRLLGDLSQAELLTGCRRLAADQAQEWFAGVDRALTAPAGKGAEDGARTPRRPGTAALFHPVAFRIALAVLGGASHSAVSSAAHLLTWELSVQCDPDHTPARPLFCDDPEADVALSRAELTDGEVEVAGAGVAARLIWYRGGALPSAVLTELWERHFPVRAPVVRWLRLLADDQRPQVWVRAAVAAGELCVRDFDHGFAELVRPLAEGSAHRRLFAATMLDQAAGHASHRKAVRKLVEDWSRSGTWSLRSTAAAALGYGNCADSAGDALDALARIGVREDGGQSLRAAAAFNVVRLLALPDSEQAVTVLGRMGDWIAHKRDGYQTLGLAATVWLASTRVDKLLIDEPAPSLGERGDWPLALALAADRPELALPIADLMWTALNTARSKDVATDALESMLRTAVRKDGTEWTRPGLAALLPALAAEETDRRRLDWLLRRMMNDPDDPFPDTLARSLWWLAVGRRSRSGQEERSHG